MPAWAEVTHGRAGGDARGNLQSYKSGDLRGKHRPGCEIWREVRKGWVSHPLDIARLPDGGERRRDGPVALLYGANPPDGAGDRTMPDGAGAFIGRGGRAGAHRRDPGAGGERDRDRYRGGIEHGGVCGGALGVWARWN